jgi:phage shock protein A
MTTLIFGRLSPDPAQRFREAKDDMERARARLADAQSEFIQAERRYQEASHAYAATWFRRPLRRTG